MHDILKQLLPMHMPVKLPDPPKQTGQTVDVHVKHEIPRAEHLTFAVLCHAQNLKRGRREKQDFMVRSCLPCCIKAFTKAVVRQQLSVSVKRNSRHHGGIVEQSEISSDKISAPTGENQRRTSVGNRKQLDRIHIMLCHDMYITPRVVFAPEIPEAVCRG